MPPRPSPASQPSAAPALAEHRLDQRVVSLGLAPSREKAQALIMAGQIEVNGQVQTKSGARVEPESEVRLRGEVLPFVSRGGLKLRHALDFFGLSPEIPGALALDVGASTGGFTDCLLQAGAARVCAVDVGYGQLAWSLRSDPRVVAIDRVNARYLDVAALPFVPTLAVCDVSFISQTLILPRLVESVGPGRRLIITLVKPQFEVGKGQVGKGGVVRDPALHQQCIERCLATARELGCTAIGVTTSPISGPAGNVEFLLALRTGDRLGPPFDPGRDAPAQET
jgi:23S rRNA (cytidine1920-2'-O)/16S rRNA (cytidine1409-2'-O)-methyltransferase